jgi:hypothetical protein
MPIKMELIENDHILHIQVQDPWNAADIPVAKEECRSFFQQANHTLHAVVDLRRAAITVPLLSASQQVIGGEPFPNSGQIAVIGVAWMMRMVAEPILRLSGNADTLAFFGSIDEAKTHLRRIIAKE